MRKEISLPTVADLARVFDPFTLGNLEREARELAGRGGATGTAWTQLAGVFADAQALAEFQRRRGGGDGGD